MYIKSKDILEELYARPNSTAMNKELPVLEKHSINFIALSPFMVISTFDKKGRIDTSPRGGVPGFVRVMNNKTLIIPDAKGNNRLDSLKNIIETGQFSSLFFVPGFNETLRVVGEAKISTSKTLLSLDFGLYKTPVSCIEVNIKEVFLHCSKSLMRSELWSLSAQHDRAAFPSSGKIKDDQLALFAELTY